MYALADFFSILLYALLFCFRKWNSLNGNYIRITICKYHYNDTPRLLNLVEAQEQRQIIVNATRQCSIPRNKSLKSKTPELNTHQSENKSWI